MLQESNSCVIDQTTLKGNKNTDSDTIIRKHRYLQKKGDYENLLNIKVHTYGSEAPI